MKRLVLPAVLLVILAPAARAQDVPKFDVYGGYSYMSITSAGNGNTLSADGWEVAGTFNLSHWLGITLDGNGTYCCSGQYLYTIMAGPQFAFRKEKQVYFLHALFGTADAKGLSETGDDFTWAAGGGIDWMIKPGWSIRAPQVDYINTHFLSGSQSDWRISVGIVFHFGKQTPPSTH
jgi:opacity protein-like surface antigen